MSDGDDEQGPARHRLVSSVQGPARSTLPRIASDPLRVSTRVDLARLREGLRQSAHERATEIRDGITSRPEAIHALPSTIASVVGQLAEETFSPTPFTEGPPPEQGWAGVIATGISTGQAVIAFPGRALDYAIAAVGSAIVPPGMGLPAAVSVGMMHVGLPHAHMHPPSYVPPAPPAPLPSIGTAFGPGCLSVLIGGMPALRAGDIGTAPSCFSAAPGFDIITGSSSVFIGGHRAARCGDLTRVCNPVGPLGIVSSAITSVTQGATTVTTVAMSSTTALEAAGIIATAAAHVSATVAQDAAAAAATSAADAQAAAASATGNLMSAAMGLAQAAADMAAMTTKATIGLDPGVPPPSVGALVGGVMNVQIGGLPVPPLGDFLNSRLHERLNQISLRRVRDALRNRVRPRTTGHPEVGPCGEFNDPIDVTTGAVVNSTLDYDSGGLFRWLRHYASDRAHRLAPLGRGVRHEYQRHLRLRLHRCTYVDERGREYEFPRFDRGRDEVCAQGFVLRRLGRGQYTVSRRGEPTMHFEGNAFARRSRLLRLTDGPRTLELVRDASSRIVAFVETDAKAGTRRRFTLQLDAEGQIAALREDGRVEPLASYGFDRSGCLVMARAGNLLDERFKYDGAHRITEHRRRDGYTVRWAYDAEGRCILTSGEDGLLCGALTYESDRTRARYRDGGEWVWRIDADGVVSAIVDPFGAELHRVRAPGLGRVVREVDAAARSTELLIDSEGLHYARLDAFGGLLPPAVAEPNPPSSLARRPLPSTALGWLLGDAVRPDPSATLGPAPRVFDLVPEECRGDIEWVFRPGANEEPLFALPEPREVKDSLGRVVARIDARGRERRWTFGRNDVLATRRDRDGREWTYAAGRAWLIGRVRDPLGLDTHYVWNDTCRVVRVVDALGTDAHYERDQKDRIVSVALNGRVLERYAWAPGDVLIAKLASDGSSLVSYANHDRGLPRRISLASGETYRCAYDWRGRLTDASSTVDEVSVRRDAADRVLWDFRNGLGVEHHREDGVTRTSVIERVEIERRAGLGGSVHITGPGGLSITIEPRGRGLVSRHLACGTSELLAFDEEGHVLGRLAWNTSDRNAPRAWACRYTRSAEGDLLEAADGSRGLTTYAVDAARRLVGERMGATERRIVLDGAGNVIEKPGLVGAQVGWANQLVRANGVELGYDERGNLVERRALDGSIVRHVFDSLDQLVRVEEYAPGGELSRAPWSAAYDALGRRVRCGRADALTELYWDGDRLAAEVGPDGRARVYVYASDEALVPCAFVDLDDAGGERAFYVFTDAVGAPLHIEDASGRIVWWAERVDPYGAIEVHPSNDLGEYRPRWPGHFYDPDLGLHYNRFRDYDPTLGRYLQLDPKGSAGGANLYAYVANPVASVDILGLSDGCKLQQQRSADEQDGEGRPRTRAPGEPETGEADATRPRNPLAGLDQAGLDEHCARRKDEILAALSADPPAGDPEHAKRAVYDVAIAQRGDDPETRRVIITNSEGSKQPHRAVRHLIAEGEWSSDGPALRRDVRVRDDGLPLIDPATGTQARHDDGSPRTVRAGEEAPEGYDRWEEVRSDTGETVGYRPYRRSSSDDNHRTGESRHHAEQRARAATRPGERLVAMAPTKRMCGGCRRAMPEMIPRVPSDMRGRD